MAIGDSIKAELSPEVDIIELVRSTIRNTCQVTNLSSCSDYLLCVASVLFRHSPYSTISHPIPVHNPISVVTCDIVYQLYS